MKGSTDLSVLGETATLYAVGSEDDRTTPITCEACGGIPEQRAICIWCERTGLMLPGRLALYRASRAQRITGQFMAYTEIVRDYVAILEKKHVKLADKLAEEGRAVLEEHDLLALRRTSQQERVEAVKRLREYEGKVLSYLAGER